MPFKHGDSLWCANHCNNHDLLSLSLACLASTLIRMWRQWTPNLFSLRTAVGSCETVCQVLLGLVVGCHGNYQTHLQPSRTQPKRKKAPNQLLGKMADVLSLRLRCRQKERLLPVLTTQAEVEVKDPGERSASAKVEKDMKDGCAVVHLLSENSKRGQPCAQFEVLRRLHQWKNPAHMKRRSSHSHRPCVWLFEGRLSSKLGQWPPSVIYQYALVSMIVT